MLAGESPFAAGSQQEMLRRVLHEPPTALATRRADVSSFLDGAVRQALAKRPDDRFPSAAAFAAALALSAGATETGSRASGSASSVHLRDPLAGGTHEQAGRRRVSARAAIYAAVVTLALGLVGGYALARSSAVERLASARPDFWQSTFEARAARSTMTGATSLTIVDRAGRPLRTIKAERPWTPRFSPDGRRLAYGAFGAGRRTSDLWMIDLTDGTDDSNDPQWSPDGATIAYSASAPGGKDLLLRKLGGHESSVLATRQGTQFPSDWLRDGSALLVTEDAGPDRHDILVQPTDGSTPSAYAATSADETAARISPDGRWVAYTSDQSGRAEVYLDSYRTPGRPVVISSGGGVHPVWRGDGRELYYWDDGALVAVRLGASSGDAPPVAGTRTVLFRAPYQGGVNTMYDVSPDGERLVIVPAPAPEER